MLTSTMRIRVEWANCDPAGIIFNPHYYIWMDAGSHALMKAAGIDMATCYQYCAVSHTRNAWQCTNTYHDSGKIWQHLF